MKLLIIGGKGMAGHMIRDYFSRKNHEVYYTSRDSFDKKSIYIDVHDLTTLKKTIQNLKPDVVINCTGILNKKASEQKKEAIYVNSLFPHLLAKMSKENQAKFIHLSTDCVFQGDRGDYRERDFPDGTSDYARTKTLGEVYHPPHLTVRTSIIGPELKKDGIGLFLWFMNQKGTIKGYKNVLWNGVTTLELAKALEKMISQEITGLYHLTAPKKISKYKLLKMIQRVFNKNDVHIVPDYEIKLDRTLVNTRKDFHYEVLDYEAMLTELKEWMNRS